MNAIGGARHCALACSDAGRLTQDGPGEGAVCLKGSTMGIAAMAPFKAAPPLHRVGKAPSRSGLGLSSKAWPPRFSMCCHQATALETLALPG